MIERDAVILITGASGSIGLEIAAQAAAAGARVIAHGSSDESAAGAVAKLTQRVTGAQLTALGRQLAEPGSGKDLIDAAAAVHARLDAIVHCATTSAGDDGGAVTGPLSSTHPETYGRFLATGVGLFQEMVHAALPYLSETRGAIVAFASDSGLYAAARQSIVAARMAAIIAFVRNVGVEVARDGVRINCISPSFVAETAIFDEFARVAGGRAQRAAERAGLGIPTPRDIAPLALFLAGPASGKITGQVISINGGLSA